MSEPNGARARPVQDRRPGASGRAQPEFNFCPCFAQALRCSSGSHTVNFSGILIRPYAITAPPRGADFPISHTNYKTTLYNRRRAQTYANAKNIVELCDYLTVKVLDPLLARSEVKWDRRFKDFFHLDNSCAPLDPVGTIRLEVPPILIGQMDQLETAIRDEADQAENQNRLLSRMRATPASRLNR